MFGKETFCLDSVSVKEGRSVREGGETGGGRGGGGVGGSRDTSKASSEDKATLCCNLCRLVL